MVCDSNRHYDASLIYLNETPYVNQSVVFTVNNVSYNRITDDNGTAAIDINLPEGVYSINTAFTDANNRRIVNSNMIYVLNISATVVSEDMKNNEIQTILDSANADETIVFIGDKYEDIALTVSKNPLNIISMAKSTLIGNSINPIFTVESKGTKISNFVLTKGNGAIYVKNSDNVSIDNNIITDNVYGITIERSNNVNIFNNSISHSLENAIILNKTSNINISSNNIISNYNGIYFDDNVKYTTIENNNISQSRNYGINLDKSGDTSSIKYNIISDNENGINIDCAGDANLIIEFNTISSSSNNGVYIGSNYRKSGEKSVLGISNNSIIYNSNFNILAKESIYNSISMGDNWIAANDPTQNRVCEKIKFTKMTMNVEQIDSNTLSLSVDGIVTPFNLRVSYNGGKNWQNVAFINGNALIHVSNEDGNVVMQYYDGKTPYQYQLSDYVAYTEPVAEDISSQTIPDQSSPEHSQNDISKKIPNDSSAQSNGTGLINNFDNGFTSPGSSSNDLSASNIAESSVNAQYPSNSRETSDNTETVDGNNPSGEGQSVIKSVNLDDENIVRISGIGLLLLVIISIIGLYYMDDIRYMLNQKNG